VASDVVSLYRAVSVDELEDVRRERRLRPGANSMNSGKHLWATLDAAQKFRADVRRLNWEPTADHILKLVFARNVVDAMELIGDNTDGCGRAYFASGDALTLVQTIEEVDE
jgi:hypothetical protein